MAHFALPSDDLRGMTERTELGHSINLHATGRTPECDPEERHVYVSAEGFYYRGTRYHGTADLYVKMIGGKVVSVRLAPRTRGWRESALNGAGKAATKAGTARLNDTLAVLARDLINRRPAEAARMLTCADLYHATLEYQRTERERRELAQKAAAAYERAAEAHKAYTAALDSYRQIPDLPHIDWNSINVPV